MAARRSPHRIDHQHGIPEVQRLQQRHHVVADVFRRVAREARIRVAMAAQIHRVHGEAGLHEQRHKRPVAGPRVADAGKGDHRASAGAEDFVGNVAAVHWESGGHGWLRGAGWVGARHAETLN
jgi:hypothetical protein